MLTSWIITAPRLVAARFPDRDFQILFRKGLNVGVDGKNQAVAVLGIHDFGVFHIGGQLVAPAVLGGDDPPAFPIRSALYAASSPSSPVLSVPVKPRTLDRVFCSG